MSHTQRFVMSLFVSTAPFWIAPLAYSAPLTLKTEPNAPRVEFTAIGRPSALKIKGKGAALTPALDLDHGTLKGALEFDLTSLETGLSLRDRHMKDKYLEVASFPKSRFEFDALKLPAAITESQEGESEITVPGKLTLHGVTQPISAKAKIRKAGNVYFIEAAFALKLTQFGIEIPKFAGITVAEDVNLDVTFETQ